MSTAAFEGSRRKRATTRMPPKPLAAHVTTMMGAARFIQEVPGINGVYGDREERS